jgi:predicted nucleotidyltransferase
MNDPLDVALSAVVAGLSSALGDDLVAVVLFGSAAEDRRRAVSDTNMAVVVTTLDPRKVSGLREVVALARVALRLRLMLLRQDEIASAASAFAVKFADIKRRRRVLYGKDPFAALEVTRADGIAQLRQSLLNLVLRLREQWLSAHDDHQLGQAAAGVAGGLRACAAELLELEGAPAPSPREALEIIAGGALPELSAARADTLAAGGGDGLLARVLALAEAMRTRAGALP